MSPGPAPAPAIDRRRYRKLRAFLAWASLQILWSDIILNRPLLRLLRSAPAPRRRAIAREYCRLAIEMGGILIKLGQFISTRVDIVPPEIIEELERLQDQVPPAPLAAVSAQIERDFGRPLGELFAWFAPEASGAASLAQAHRARLPSGEPVVVKVLRPGIERLFQTDLAVIRSAVRLIKYYRAISSKIDLDWIVDEFTTVTLRELDFAAEAASIERFAELYAADPQVAIPAVFHAHCAAHTLTMEDVGYIRIDNIPALTAAGISPRAVVSKLNSVYMEQFFVHHLVHADPHAGNLFVRPLPQASELAALPPGQRGFRPGDPVPYAAGRGFQIVIVDFGMVVAVPPRLQNALREYMIGVTTNDVGRVMSAYVDGGMLAPGADIARLEELTEHMLANFRQVLLGQFRNMRVSDRTSGVLQQYLDLMMFDAPLQFQADLLFVYRAMSILSGLTVRIDPDYDPLEDITPFVQDQMRATGEQALRDDLLSIGQTLARLPRQVGDVLTQAQRGRLVVRAAQTPETLARMRETRQAIRQLAWSVVAAALLLSGVVWHFGTLLLAASGRAGEPPGDIGPLLIGLALISLLWGWLRRA